MLKSVTIHGEGIAAACCARLLTNRGIPVSIQRASRPHLPSLLVSPSTQSLLADVFADQSLFSDFPVITKRIVLWHNQTAAVELPHSGAVVPESILLERLWSKLDFPYSPIASAHAELDWLVKSQKKPDSPTMDFGARIATASAVQLSRHTAVDACYVEALDSGWLFLLPTAPGCASLISVGSPMQQLLERSRLIASHVDSISPNTASFAAYPRTLDRLCAPGWFACGTAAMGFDPICGEGAGNAVREAILLSAALGFIAQHSDVETVLDHYSARLFGGFLKHLHLCRDFYSAAPQQDWWNSELSMLEQGIHWCEQKLRTFSSPQFRLAGFDLQRLNLSS